MADGTAGLQIVDVRDPSNLEIVGGVDTLGEARGVDARGAVVVVADHREGIQVIDASNPTAPLLVGSLKFSVLGTFSGDLVLDGSTAYVADLDGLRIVNVANPAAPTLLASSPGLTWGAYNDLAQSGRLLLAADALFANDVPVIDVGDPANPLFRARIGFPGNEDGTGVSPTAAITSPAAGSEHTAGTTVTVRAQATDDVGVASVTFLVDGVPAHTDSAAPFEFDLFPGASCDPPSGTFSWMTRALIPREPGRLGGQKPLVRSACLPRAAKPRTRAVSCAVAQVPDPDPVAVLLGVKLQTGIVGESQEAHVDSLSEVLRQR